jgi:hypothetical protein
MAALFSIAAAPYQLYELWKNVETLGLIIYAEQRDHSQFGCSQKCCGDAGHSIAAVFIAVLAQSVAVTSTR